MEFVSLQFLENVPAIGQIALFFSSGPDSGCPLVGVSSAYSVGKSAIP